MATLAASDLVAAWERVLSAPPRARPGALLQAFSQPETHLMGTQEEALLSIYANNFGVSLDGVAGCPQCSTEVEVALPVARLRAGIPEPAPVEPFTVAGRTVHWRLPHDADLLAAADCPDAEAAARLLFSRCILALEPDDEPADAEWEAIRAALAQRVAAADPYADITFELGCPECATVWQAGLEMAEFVWAHLQSRARRLLGEVHELASAYGWSEREILALPQTRRDSYLELVRNG